MPRDLREMCFAISEIYRYARAFDVAVGDRLEGRVVVGGVTRLRVRQSQ